MCHRLRVITSFLLALTVFALAAAPSLAAPALQDSTPLPESPQVVRIYYTNPSDMAQLHDYDVFEYNNVKEGYFLAAVSADDIVALQKSGFRVELDAERSAQFNYRPQVSANQVNGIPGYACYRTVEETFQTAQAIVAAHPTLASWVDVGDTWDKVTAGGAAGYDMMVLKLTNSAIGGTKPKLFITSSIHAREYTPAELVTRFAEYLINNYGVNPDVTWLLDYHEIHLMLQTNPDGRKQAETGLSWRKNTNQNYCGAASTARGADLNRNFNFQWGCCNGSSASACNETYRGPSAASEPEVQAIQAYMRAIFPDQRGSLLTDPAPANATGVYLDIHSYSELVLWPWGFTSTVPPNGPALQTLGRKFAYFNSYTPEQSIGLYATDGTTDDFIYGDLGVAGYTIELGTDFFEDCATFENTIVPGNLPALLYAAKVARTPYQTPAGPDALNVAVTPATVTVGDAVELIATIDDARFNNSNGTEPTQAIAAAEYYVDTPPWQVGAVPHAMAASDGSFNTTLETVAASVDTSSMSTGRHLIYVRGRDAAGNWGSVSAAFLNIEVLSVTSASVAVCSPANAIYTVNVGYPGAVTLAASNVPANATATFSANPVNGPASSMLTIGNTAAVTPGTYTVDIAGTYAGGSQTKSVQLNIANQSGGPTTLTAPANAATNMSITPTFTWNAATQAASYRFELASNASFTNIIHTASGLTTTSYAPPVTLNTSGTYYWRVYADNACGSAGASSVFHFTTLAAPGDCAPGSTPNILFSDGFEAGLGSWTKPAGTGTNTWAIATANPHAGAQHMRGVDSASVTDQRLVSPAITLPAGENPVVLKFWHLPNTENNGTTGCYDGGILEVSNNAGATWTQVSAASMLQGGYTGALSSSYSNPLGGLQAWCGGAAYTNTIADVSSYAGQTVQVRFRLGSDTSVGDTGWDVDDVVVQSCRTLSVYDVNTDGQIDIVDIQLVAGAFGTTNPAYDFNHSGSVDILDIQAAVEHWYTGV